jgi:putative ABC transport system permease protein
VLFVSLRDLQWRRRRFMISVFATGLVFALAVLITGISASFHNEVGRAIKAFHADEWIVSNNATGPFTTPVLIPESTAATVVALNPGVAAEPLATLRFTVHTSRVRDLNVIGAIPGKLGMPKIADGKPVVKSGDIVVDRSLGVPVGRKLTIGGLHFTVVGRTKGISYFAGTPVVFMSLHDAQDLSLGGQPLASSIVVKGHVTKLPPGTHSLTNAQTISDLRRPLKSATGTISILQYLLWIVAAGIIGSVLYLQAIERMRDFAVFKATGVTGRSLAVGLAFQAIVLAIASAIVAMILAYLLAPVMPMNVETPPSTFVVLPIVAVIVSLLASISGLRRAVGVDPALAFGGA